MKNKYLEPIIERGYFEKGDIVSLRLNQFGNEQWAEDLSMIFPTENCVKNRSCMADAFWWHNTFCGFYIMEYKTLTYITEVGNDLVEQDIQPSMDALQKFSGDEKILVFAHYSPADKSLTSWTGETAIVFLGCYQLDLTKTKENGFAYLRLLSNRLYIGVNLDESICVSLDENLYNSTENCN